eukprot:CAMPEP_0174821644 /NCGR_PEP_ID=MMETSP1107-20130205/9151_1 /TAXON_ID=36770 /ORGANISM="Paraphysomonas vestita, Strain GFlagA" /LENGTH=289 /DNA_ID=CAMNT_0016038911 /DNA_START=21 /DNA_END=887 /DNA_ORIENTATION=+
MTDRLADLQKGAPVQFNQTTNELHSNGNSNFLKTFFGDVEIVKRNLLSITETTNQIGEIDQAVSLATTPEKEHELTSGLSPLIVETNQKAQVVKTLLQRLREECDDLKKKTTAQNELNELRIRDNLINTLTRKFVEVMKAYQNAQQKFKVDIKKKMKRQIQMVNPSATDGEIDVILRTGGSSGDVLRSAILKGGASDLIKNASRNVEDKYQEVLTLEQSVTQLHEMFVDFAQLTEQQGELLDQIEFQVKSASDFIEEANADMRQAVESAKELRKRQCCLLIILLVVIGV